MARPIKTGLSYFPLDAWLFEDRKIQRLIKKFKSEGVAVYLAVVCDIYKKYGYYIPYSNDYCFDLSFVLNLPEKSVQDILLYCVEIKLFDEGLFHNRQLLSSLEIQKQYIEICKRSKNCITQELLIVPESAFSEVESPVFAAKTTVSTVKNTPNKKKGNINTIINKDNSFYEWVTGYFNTVFSNKLTMVKKLTEKRRMAIESCVTCHGKPAVKQMLDNASCSPFLLGENNCCWRADFDWLFNPNNFIKVFEGTYLKQNEHAQNKQTDSASLARKAAILQMAADATASDRDTYPLR